jgi:carbon-monoxide dehydrogenase large subunit
VEPIAAEPLGVPFEDIEVIHDAARAPYGMDTYGRARWSAAWRKPGGRAASPGRAIAAHLMEIDPGDLDFEAARSGSREPRHPEDRAGGGVRGVQRAQPAGRMEPTLHADSTIDPQTFSFPHGTHLCAAEVDAGTGAVGIRSYVCVDDMARW